MEPHVVIALVLTGLAAAASFAAAFAAWKAVEATRLDAESGLVLRYLEKYDDERMARALRELTRFKRQNEKDFADKWRSAMRSGEAWAKDIDLARRQVKGYFITLTQIHEEGLLRERLFKLAVCQVGLAVLCQVDEPLERALNPDGYGSHYFETLRNVCGSQVTDGPLLEDRL